MPQTYDRGVRDFATLADMVEYEDTARDLTPSLLVDQITDLSSAANTFVRPAVPDRDLDVNDEETGIDPVTIPDAPVWATTFDQSQDWSAGEYGWYHFNNDGPLDDKTAVIYGYEFVDSDLPDGVDELPITEIAYYLPQGGLLAEHDISNVNVGETPISLIEDPITVKKTDLYARIAIDETIPSSTDTTDYVVGLRPLMVVAEETGDTYTDAPKFFTNGGPQRGHTEFATMADMLDLERSARDRAAQMLVRQIPDLNSRDETFVRPAIVGRDLNGNDSYADPTAPSWEIASGDLTADSYNDLYHFDNDDRMKNKAAVIYGYELQGDTNPLTQITYELPQGGLLAEHDLTPLATGAHETDQGHVVLLEDPIEVNKTDLYTQVYADEAADVTLRFLMQVAEETDETYTETGNFYVTGNQRFLGN